MHGIKKKLVAALTVVALVVSALATALPAYAAEGDGTITVTSSSKEFDGQTVGAYRVFDVQDGSYVLNDAFEDFFVSKKGLANDDTLSAKAYQLVNKLGKDDSAAVIDFAKEMRAWMLEQDPALIADDSATAQQTGDAYTATLTVAPGYYLVVPGLGSTGVNNRGTDAMLVNVTAGQTSMITLKSEYPTVEKTVNGAHGVMDQIGSTVEFTVKSKVPDTTNYKTYNMKFTDTFTDGLTFVPGSVEVTIGESVMVEDADYTVTEPTSGINKLVVDLTNIKQHIEDHEYAIGDEIVITYSVTVNDKAVVADPETNSVQVNYSNNPNGGYDGVTEPSEDKVYTYDINLHKFASGNESDLLAGAEFKLFTSEDDANAGRDPIKFVKIDDTHYRVATAEEINLADENLTDTIVTVDTGEVNIAGLGDGEYWLKETKQPDGYNLLAAPIKITITPTFDVDGTLLKTTVTVGDSANSDNDNTVKVENKTGIELPGTGGMGTVIFTVVGVAVVAGGAIWMVQRNRRNAASNGSHMA